MKHEMRKYIDTFKQKLTESENLNISDVSDSLSPKETLTLLMKIWERIPLGTRMSCGGMEREIPKEIRELLDKFGYKIVKK
jgi:hypothetical protein